MPRGNSNKPRRRRTPERGGKRVKKKSCSVCEQSDGYIDYKDVALLRRFMSDRSKIRSSRVTGLCGTCQRKVARAIKNAREMALLSYTNR